MTQVSLFYQIMQVLHIHGPFVRYGQVVGPVDTEMIRVQLWLSDKPASAISQSIGMKKHNPEHTQLESNQFSTAQHGWNRILCDRRFTWIIALGPTLIRMWAGVSESVLIVGKFTTGSHECVERDKICKLLSFMFLFVPRALIGRWYLHTQFANISRWLVLMYPQPWT